MLGLGISVFLLTGTQTAAVPMHNDYHYHSTPQLGPCMPHTDKVGGSGYCMDLQTSSAGTKEWGQVHQKDKVVKNLDEEDYKPVLFLA
jgi:hypothetical protein